MPTSMKVTLPATLQHTPLNFTFAEYLITTPFQTVFGLCSKVLVAGGS